MANSSSSTYLLGRTGSASARLTFQHFSKTLRQGWQLHPDVYAAITVAPRPTSAPIRIADLATGNAIWALEVSRTWANSDISIEITGLDISSDQYPPNFTLPANVRLGLYDLYQPVPDRYKGYFDVVHIRLICAAIYASDKDVLMRNLLLLLKPGGYIQWDEATDPLVLTVTPDRSKQPMVCHEITDAMKRVYRIANFRAACKWAHTLPDVFKQYGLEQVTGLEPPVVVSALPSETQSLLWTMTEFMQFGLAKAPDNQKAMVREEIELALREARAVLDSGAMFAYSWMVAVGRKPCSSV